MVEIGDVKDIFCVLCYFYIQVLLCVLLEFVQDKVCLVLLLGVVLGKYDCFNGCLFNLCCFYVMDKCCSEELVFVDLIGGC